MPINSFENYPMSWKPKLEKINQPKIVLRTIMLLCAIFLYIYVLKKFIHLN